MRSVAKLCALLAGAVILAGCASNPKVSLQYYLAETSVKVKVVRTVACDAGNHPIIATTVTPIVTHTADRSEVKQLNLTKLDSALANSDTRVEFYEDGRLKGVNATATGQGEAILKSLITLATPLFGFGGEMRGFTSECQFIKDQGGGKPLTVTYFDTLTLDERDFQPVRPEDASAYYQANLGGMIGGVCVATTEMKQASKPVTLYGSVKGDAIAARQPAAATVQVKTDSDLSCASPTDLVWEGQILIAQKGTPYSLPIPKAAPFGKRVFSASFAESGALSSVQYGSETGAPGLLGVVNAGAAVAGDETTSAEKAAELKAEADVIAQQQRLVGCLADPKNCK